MLSHVELANGRYLVRGVLGEGAQGTTYEAVEAASRRAVAIKRFDVRGARSWKDVELAEREVRVLATLDHPLVPRYIEHFEHDGGLYLVMEKVEGETLEAIRRREGCLSEAEVRRFIADADRALTYLHGRGAPIVHRDIKPRNVVRRPNGSYVLVDFGAVSELVKRTAGASTVVGTMGYMAPEQLHGRALPATDVYAVGATALAALTGAEPETLPLRGLRIDVRAALQGRASPALVDSLERMLEPDPERRAPSIAAALDAGPSHAHPPPVAPMHAAPVHAAPMHAAPVHAAPMHAAPVHAAPMHAAPMHAAPVHAAPMHAAPVHAAPMHAPPTAPPFDVTKEDAMLRSLRKLLWVLWGLGWVLVPVTLGHLGAGRLVPLVMFGSLAALFVLTWHKNALLRMALRAVTQRGQQRALPPPAAQPVALAPRQRVDVAPQVRVHTSELRPDEVVGQTEWRAEPPKAARHHR